MDLKELENGVDPRVHWYYRTKKKPLIKFLKKIKETNPEITQVIDVGSGSGYFAEEVYKDLPGYFEKIYLVDIGYSESGMKEYNSKNKILQKVTTVPNEMRNSIIVMMDVLEHIEDDYSFLGGIVEKCKGKNYFFITVPAFKGLWSYHDVYLGHYRRYTLNTIERLFVGCNTQIKNSYYLFFLLFPFAYIIRRLKRNSNDGKTDMQSANPLINTALLTYFSFEVFFIKLNKFFGLSCCVEAISEK